MPPLAPEGYCGLLDAKCHALHPQTLLSPYMEASNAGVSRPVTHGGLHKHLSLTLSLPPPPHTRTHTLNSTDSKGDVQAGHAYLATTSTSEDAPCPVRRPPVRNPFMRQRERESEREGGGESHSQSSRHAHSQSGGHNGEILGQLGQDETAYHQPSRLGQLEGFRMSDSPC